MLSPRKSPLVEVARIGLPIAILTLGVGVFFAIGSLKSRFLAKPMLPAGLRTLATGGTAAALAWITGYLLRTLVGV